MPVLKRKSHTHKRYKTDIEKLAQQTANSFTIKKGDLIASLFCF
jgi:hypothetical protein